MKDKDLIMTQHTGWRNICERLDAFGVGVLVVVPVQVCDQHDPRVRVSAAGINLSPAASSHPKDTPRY